MALQIGLKYIFFILIILAAVLEVIGDIYLKKWAMESKNLLFIIGMALYIVGSVFWALSLKYEYLSKAVSVFFVLNMVILVLAGALLFKENLSLTNKIGITLAIISIVLIEA